MKPSKGFTSGCGSFRGWPAAVPAPLVRFIGVAEFLGGLGLILPAATRVKPMLTPLAGVGLAVAMLLAAGFHTSRGEFGAAQQLCSSATYTIVCGQKPRFFPRGGPMGLCSPPIQEGQLRTSTLLCTAGLMLLAGGAAAQDVNYDYDRNANWSAYRTYAWAGGTNLADNLNHARIVAAVDSQLGAKGLARVDSTGNPDVLVVYRVGLHQDLEMNGYDNRWAVPSGGPSWARVERVPVGTLVVGIIDAKTHSMVWRAAATKDLDLGQSPEKWERNLNKAVEKMFKHYPGSGQAVR